LRSWEVFLHIRYLNRTQWGSPQDIRRIQLEKLKALIKHAYENVPFYHRKFSELKLKPRDIKCLRDLEKLPILTKDDLRGNFPDTLARNYNIKILKRRSTSGSTGKPLEIYEDKWAIWRDWSAYYRFASWCGFYPTDKMVSITTARPWSYLSFSLSTRLGNICRRWLQLTAYRMNEQTLHDISITLRRFKPKILRGFTSPIFLLADFLRRTDINEISPIAVVTTGETLQGFQRRLIESIFNCRVYNFYGSNEIQSIAQECPERSGLHINAENRIVEFVRGSENASSGEEGEIVITDLNNFAMPLIRYNMEDVGIPSNEPCMCGRGLPLIKELRGRVCDLIVGKDGTLFAGEFFALPAPYILKNYEWIQQFQIFQPSREELVIKIIKSTEPKNHDLEYLTNRIRKYLGDIEVKIEFVESIPTASKHRFTISKVTQELFRRN